MARATLSTPPARRARPSVSAGPTSRPASRPARSSWLRPMEPRGSATPSSCRHGRRGLSVLESRRGPGVPSARSSRRSDTKAAAGAAGLIKAALALHHKVLPPTIKVDRPSKSRAEQDAVHPAPSLAPGCGSRSTPTGHRECLQFGGSNFLRPGEEEAEPEPLPWSHRDGDTRNPRMDSTIDEIRTILGAFPPDPGLGSPRLEAARSRSGFAHGPPRLVLVIRRNPESVQ